MIVEKFFADHLGQMKIVTIETIWKGIPGERSKSGMSLVELSSRGERDIVLKKMSEEGISFKDVGGEKLAGTRAKSAAQLKRNGCLRQAEKKIKQDAAAATHNVEIVWLAEGTKTRGVNMDGHLVCRKNFLIMQVNFLLPSSIYISRKTGGDIT